MPKTCFCGGFSLFHRCRASARLPSQKQKSIRNSCVFGALQFKIVIFLMKQGIKSTAYCRMPRFLTQFQRKQGILNHIGFDSPQLTHFRAVPANIRQSESVCHRTARVLHQSNGPRRFLQTDGHGKKTEWFRGSESVHRLTKRWIPNPNGR